VAGAVARPGLALEVQTRPRAGAPQSDASND
jgi:hypothetical protein